MSRTYLDPPRPIAALATAPGRAALAVIRASGPECIGLAARCFSRPRALLSAPGHSLVHGFLSDPDTKERIDEALATVFRAPRSFTGEDCVEFSCHGSPAVVRRALAALERAGFAPALPGEFTFRAFAGGKTDLVGAEAIDELVRSPGDLARAEALKRLSGRLSRNVGELRSALVDILAEVEARLDYPADEGPEEEVSWPARVGEVLSRIERLAASFPSGRLRQEGALVVVAGRPNAGKSSLFNLVLREERAIVSPEPGTTRDWLEAWFELESRAIRLADTAGLRESADPVESAGVARSGELVRRADLVLYIVDGRVGVLPGDAAFMESRTNILGLWNKIDDPACLPVPPGWTGISATAGTGLKTLESAIVSALDGSGGAHPASAGSAGGAQPATASAAPSEADVLVASARQKGLLDLCAASLRDALAGLAAGISLDILALDLREAADRLGEMTGEISGEEVLDRVFGSFCLGK